jgi:hypothetical protein
LTMQRSIISTVFDLMEFEGHGNFGQFDRCFRKACAFFALVADDAAFRKLRNIAFYYLRSIGYLDANNALGSTSWSTAPPSLVQRGEQDFVLIAGSGHVAAVVAAAPSDGARLVRSSDGGLVPETIPFFPSVLCMNLSVAEAQDLCRRENIKLSLSYQSRIFQHLPSIDSVLQGAVTQKDDSRPFEPDSAERFDFATCTWQRVGETRAVEEGLYRQLFDHGPPTYSIVAPARQKPLATFRVVEREWVLVVALALLRKVLPIRYEKDSERLYVSKRYHAALRLPTLIERSLRSGTLLNPTTTQEWFEYQGIRGSSVANLTAKLPMFSAKEKR